MSDSQQESRAAWVPGVVLAAVGWWVWWRYMNHAVAGDAEFRFKALAALVNEHRWEANKYSLIGPLFAAPAFWLGDISETAEWWCARFNQVVFALFLVASWFLMRHHVPRAMLARFILLLCAASMFPKHIQGFYGEVFSACTVAVGLLVVCLRGAWWGWLLCALGAANTPACIIPLGLVCLAHAVSTRRVRHLAAPLLAVALVVLESYVRRGELFATGYEGDVSARTVLPYSNVSGFGYPLLFGLLSIMLSFGKGLVFYTPGAFLPWRAAASEVSAPMKHCARLWLLYSVGLVLLYSKWHAWHGGWYWGPRFFLFVCIPASFILAVRISTPGRPLMDLLVAVVLALSAWVGLAGAVYSQHDMGICQANNFASEFLCWYTPEFSALVRPLLSPANYGFNHHVMKGFILVALLYLVSPVAVRLAQTVRERVSTHWMHVIPFIRQFRW